MDIPTLVPKPYSIYYPSMVSQNQLNKAVNILRAPQTNYLVV